MVKKSSSEQPEMISLTNQQNGRCAHWCALVTLIAVCSLAASVATRYSHVERVSTSATISVHGHSSHQPSRQRLTKDAAGWIPPVAVSTPLKAPSVHRQVALPGFLIPTLQFDSDLYNRPPPFQHLS